MSLEREEKSVEVRPEGVVEDSESVVDSREETLSYFARAVTAEFCKAEFWTDAIFSEIWRFRSDFAFLVIFEEDFFGATGLEIEESLEKEESLE